MIGRFALGRIEPLSVHLRLTPVRRLAPCVIPLLNMTTTLPITMTVSVTMTMTMTMTVTVTVTMTMTVTVTVTVTYAVRAGPAEESPPPDPGRPDERSLVTEASGHHSCPACEIEAAPTVHLGLGRLEERLTEPERHRSAHHREREIEQIDDRGDRSPYQQAGPRHELGRRKLGGLPADGGQGGARSLRLEAPSAAAVALPAVGHHGDVADVSGVPEPPVEQPSVHDDAATDAGRDDHGDVVGRSSCGADPSFAERERLGVVVDVRRETASPEPAATATETNARPRC